MDGLGAGTNSGVGGEKQESKERANDHYWTDRRGGTGLAGTRQLETETSALSWGIKHEKKKRQRQLKRSRKEGSGSPGCRRRA